MWRQVEVIARQSPDPIPGIRSGHVVVFDLSRPVPTASDPERVWVERTFLLLDVGVQFKRPHWWLDDEPDTWYVDLVKVDKSNNRIVVRDLYIDLIVPTDGRPCRMLDLHEFGDALESGELSLDDAVDGLRRWQAFLDRYVQIRGLRQPAVEWRDFPPVCIRPLLDVERLDVSAPHTAASGE